MSHLIKKIVLASQSKFRKTLLSQTNIAFTTHAALINEHEILAATPKETAEQRAISKADSVASCLNDSCLVIGCDQTLELENKMLNKPKSQEKAYLQLKKLSGKQHTLHSAVSLVCSKADSNKVLKVFTVSTPMYMRQLSLSEINQYIESNEWQGCVGAYRIEGRGVNLFNEKTALSLDTSAVMGLPLLSLLESLRILGINPLTNQQGPWPTKGLGL
ncbi:MAG: septum formation protein Maf [Zetaproteobacteria bacterium]|nr:septum formation protein Maf [Pseudobdellovibrionaceae bacterium]|tara:strand:+ start:220 stop:870 length:651 start_codon:yes stop_codon:yes gene_type:complete